MAPHLIAGFALTGLVGASLGLLGAGGSIIMLPVLVYVVGVEPHAAVPLSLAIVGTTSLVSVAVHSRGSDIQWGAALFVGGAALGGTYLGSRLTGLMPGSVLLLSFGVLLVLVGFRMWRSPGDAQVTTTPRRPTSMLVAGSFVGVLTGFLGVGGGFLIVPALLKVGGPRYAPGDQDVARRHRDEQRRRSGCAPRIRQWTVLGARRPLDDRSRRWDGRWQPGCRLCQPRAPAPRVRGIRHERRFRSDTGQYADGDSAARLSNDKEGRCDVDGIGRSCGLDCVAMVGAATTGGTDVSGAEPARGAGMRIQTRD